MSQVTQTRITADNQVMIFSQNLFYLTVFFSNILTRCLTALIKLYFTMAKRAHVGLVPKISL